MSKPSVVDVRVGQVWLRKPGREMTSGGVHFYVSSQSSRTSEFRLVPVRQDGDRWVFGAKDANGRTVKRTDKWRGGIQSDMVHVADDVVPVDAP